MSLKNRLLSALPFSKYELDALISSAPFRYKEYRIPKREKGKFREISQPTPELKLAQRWIIANELIEFPIHKSATAYRLNTGLISNVTPHQNNRFLLKLDFKDFFPSITASAFTQFMANNRFSEEDLAVLCNLLFKINNATRRLSLAIGAPSSPTLSNILLYPLDISIEQKCTELDIKYTRYADDLSFSTNTPNVLKDFEEALPELIRVSTHLNLKINPKKTVHASKKNGRRITGLMITSENRISIGRDRKRLLRSQIHRYILGNLGAEELESLKGYMSFLNSVEPEHVNRLKYSYGDDVILKLIL